MNNNSNAVRYGLFAGLGTIVVMLLLYMIDAGMIFGWALQATWLIYLFCMYKAVDDTKNENGDFDAYEKGPKNIPWKILNEFTGSDLEGINYEQLLPYAQPEDGDAFRVIIGDFVTTTDGTGIVHIAPSFGADDNKVGKQNGIAVGRL